MAITYDVYKEIELYAHRHTESSRELYIKRNENSNRIFLNILRGKLAEYACYYSMQEAGYILKNKPDLTIYSEYNPDLESDLICIGKNNELYSEPRHIHVKCVSIETYKKIGISFLIEKNNPLVNNPDPNHYFSVMLQKSLTQYDFCRWLCSVDAVYSKPRNEKLWSKKAVYFNN